MATISSALSDLPLEQLALYHASDPYLSSFLIFYGPFATTNATVSSSRIQAHILTPAGFQSYPRITISPAAPLYAAVSHLPREKQGDEVCRALAVSMLKYFADLSDPTKQCLMEMARAGRPGAGLPKMFDEMHAADLANRMTLVENPSGIVHDIRSAFQERKTSWIDLDVVLPAGTIQFSQKSGSDNTDFDGGPSLQYSQYSSLIQTLGSPIFLPTSRLKRAPSQPTNVSKSRLFSKSQKEAVRLSMCELVDTEERYVGKLYALVHSVAEEFRLSAQARPPSSTGPDEPALAALFPACLNEILEINMGFLELIRHVLEATETDAIADIADDTELPPSSHGTTPKEREDPIGVVGFAKALHEWFPRFSQPYADYMRAHQGFSQTLNTFMKDKNSSFSKRIHETGEQTLRSLLMEPVQRLPRYSLLIDTMMGSLPLVHPAVRPLLKARDIIKDICSLDNPSSMDHDQGIRRLKEIVNGWPAILTPAGRLISAVDVSEVPPPYHINSDDVSPSTGILLIYKNCLVLLSKAAESRVTSRALLAELDNATSNANEFASISSTELKVVQVYDLHAVRCTHSVCGRILFLVPASYTKSGADQTNVVDLLALKLSGMYEGRANRLLEEIVKASIEGRFSDSERENGKWTLRTPTGTVGNLGMLACVFEEDQGAVRNRTRPSTIKVIFDTPKAVCNQILGSSNLEVIVSVSSPIENQYRVDIDSIVGNASSDMVTADSFIHVLSKRRKY